MDELRIGGLDRISEFPDLTRLRLIRMNELISRMYKLRIGGLDRISELPNLTRMEELGSRMDELGIGGLDRISELPDHLLHHILSFIPMQDVGKTCFLSRSWRRVCYSNPIFKFNLHSYSQRFDQRYIKFFDNAMQRFHRHETGMQKLNIVASIKGAPEFVRMVDKWIEISLEKNVQELDIWIYRYDLPQSIFASKSLHTLCLSRITMPSIFTTYTRVFSLRKLSLYGVSLKEQTLQSLIFKFPFIENLDLKDGVGDDILINLQKIRVSGLCNLKEFTIFAWQALEEIDIDAPSLKFFHYGSSLGTNNIKIKTGSTKNVETLSITHDTTITYQRFHDLISKFPLLKCLHVEQCHMLKEIKISSNRLQRFSFVDSFFMPSLVKVEIDAPNLIFFEYSGQVEPEAMLLVKTPPSCSKAHIYLKYHVDWCCFISLREFLTSSMQFKFLSLQIFDEVQDGMSI
jgi:hypothetical protein